MDRAQPTLDEWRRLYEAAAKLKEEAPWEWMFEDEIFGVRNPETGQIGYVSIMGANGEHLALAVYLGSKGLDGFWRLSRGEGMEDPGFLLEVPQLQISFEDREMVDKEDRAVMKALDLRFRGRQAWPLFRSYRPGCAPWFLTAEEARFLARVTEQALDVIARLGEDPDLLEPPEDDDEYLVRVQTEAGWQDEWLSPESVPVRPPPAVDIERLTQMRKELPRQSFTLEAELFTLPSFIKDEEDERPYLPYSLMIVEAESGLILAMELMVAKPSLDAVWEQAAAKLLDTLSQMGALPKRIAVRSERLQNILIPIAAGLGSQLQISPRLPALDEARTAMEMWMH